MTMESLDAFRDQFPCESRFATIDGCRVHYVDEGKGPVLLFLHGNPAWSFLYRHIIRELRGSFRCVALDYPGFGLSAAREGYDFRPASHAKVVKGFIEALDLGEVTMMVQDWGGPIGFWAAAAMPKRMHGLVIGNTFAWPVSGDPHFERFSAMMGGALGGFLIRRFNLFVNLLVPAGCARRKPSPDVMRA